MCMRLYPCCLLIDVGGGSGSGSGSVGGGIGILGGVGGRGRTCDVEKFVGGFEDPGKDKSGAG
jgi:hypothetical protein